METRRDTLKIIGAIGTTCAFPFAANDLYGQHQHGAFLQAQRGPYILKFSPRSNIRPSRASPT